MKRKVNNRQADSLQTVKSAKPAAQTAKYPTRNRPLEPFLQTAEIKTRQCVYIDRDTHRKVAYIIRQLGDDGLSIGKFVDNILRDHIQRHKEQYTQAIAESQNISL